MNVVLKVAGAIAAGIITSFVLVVAVELFGTIVHPVPATFSGAHQEMCAHVANFPQWVLAVVVPMWGCTAFIGTWVAGRLGNGGSAVVLAVLLLTAVMSNVSMLPYPLWFKIVQPIAILGMVSLGYRRSIRRSPALPGS